MKLLSIIPRIIIWLRPLTCRHEFLLKDLDRTEIAAPAMPVSGSDYNAWLKYHDEIYNSEFHTKRVKWPCRKCGEVFWSLRFRYCAASR